MRRFFTLLILVIIFSVLFVQSGVYKNILGVGTAFAVGDLSVDWGVPSGNPIFTVSGMAPGQTQSHTVHVTNNSPVARIIGVSGNKVLETGSLGNVLLISVSQNGSDVYGGTLGSKTLTQFFTESAVPGFVTLSSLNSTTSTDYVFTVKFTESAGNEYQNKNINFDLIIGLAVDIPTACQSITFNGSIINGTSGNDNLVGTNKNDLIISLEGNDNIASFIGNDCIVSGPGNDKISTENGDDVVDSGIGNDQVALGNGDDKANLGDGNDAIDGGNGVDTIAGGAGNDTMTGSNGNDTLSGETGTDTAVGGNGTDTCSAETKAQCEP